MHTKLSRRYESQPVKSHFLSKTEEKRSSYDLLLYLELSIDSNCPKSKQTIMQHIYQLQA